MVVPSVKILLVEDSPGDARLIRELLRMAGSLDFEISGATRLAEAAGVLAERGADLVLLDLNLPDSRGGDTVTGMLRLAPDTPVIVLTGLHDEEIAVRAVHAGAQDYLVKGQISGDLLVRAIRYALEREAREREQRRVEAAERFLAEAGRVLAKSLDPRTTLRSIAELTVPGLADWCAVDLLDESGRLQAVEVVASEGEVEELLRGVWVPGDSPLRAGEPRLIALRDALPEPGTDDPARLEVLGRIGSAPVLLVPMVAGGRAVGLLVLGSCRAERRFDERDLSLATELGRRAALAAENARLYTESREAQRRAEIAAEELRGREALISALAAALTPQQVASVVIQHGLSMLRARLGVVYLLDEERGRFDLLRAAGLPEESLAPWRSVAAEAEGPLADAVRLGRPLVVAPDDWAARYPGVGLLGTSGGPTGVVSLSAGPRTLGVLAFELSSGEETEAAQRLLQSCAGKCALALERALLFEREQEARAQAERAIRARDEILGVVAHDLRNPLGAVSSYAALLEDDTTDRERRRYLNAIFESTSRMDRLIQDLLDVSRLDAGHLRMDVKPVAVPALLYEAVEAMRALAERKGVGLRTDVPATLPRVPLDRDRILQVLGNLVGNALRFTPTGGSIVLGVEPLGREVLFLVADTGPGIPAEHLPHLFDRFWQARETRSSGAGLGLAIVKGIVEAHGGRVGVESRVGLGSTFFFALPAGAAEAEPAPEPIGVVEEVPVVAPEEEPARPVRVLLVDDHPVVRRGLAERLRREPGFEVVGEVSSGEEAVEQARVRRPDVVLMDLTMPGMGGLEATRRITGRDPGVRVLAVTAEAEQDTLLPVLAAGGSGFVRKSTAYEDLVPALHAVARDEVYLYPSGNRLLLRDYMASEDRSRELRLLSQHERDILALAAEGYNSEEIGRRLFLSPKTVDSYRSRAMRSLGLGHRSELVRFALRTGLLAAGRGTAAPRPGQ